MNMFQKPFMIMQWSFKVFFFKLWLPLFWSIPKACKKNLSSHGASPLIQLRKVKLRQFTYYLIWLLTHSDYIRFLWATQYMILNETCTENSYCCLYPLEAYSQISIHQTLFWYLSKIHISRHRSCNSNSVDLAWNTRA
jgi:hypothetical protein